MCVRVCACARVCACTWRLLRARALGDSYEIYCKAKIEEREIVYSQTGIQMDIPDAIGKGGTTNKGNICERLLKDHCHILVSLVPLRFHSEISDLLNRLWVTLVVYTSTSKDEIIHFSGRNK